jgi:hypothetical protein
MTKNNNRQKFPKVEVNKLNLLIGQSNGTLTITYTRMEAFSATVATDKLRLHCRSFGRRKREDIGPYATTERTASLTSDYDT